MLRTRTQQMQAVVIILGPNLPASELLKSKLRGAPHHIHYSIFPRSPVVWFQWLVEPLLRTGWRHATHLEPAWLPPSALCVKRESAAGRKGRILVPAFGEHSPFLEGGAFAKLSLGGPPLRGKCGSPPVSFCCTHLLVLVSFCFVFK